MRFSVRVAVAIAVSFATYFVLVFAALFVAGGAVSCSNNCTDTAEFLNNAAPWPMIIGIGVSVAAGAWAMQRVRR